MTRVVTTGPAQWLIFVVQLYRNTVSPLRLPSCRFTPTCSQYAVDALTEYGLVRGGWLTVARLARCGPWHRGGWDPIPDRPHRETQCGHRAQEFLDEKAEGEHRVL